MYAIKLALATVLCGGVERVDAGGTRVRGEPHMVRKIFVRIRVVLGDY